MFLVLFVVFVMFLLLTQFVDVVVVSSPQVGRGYYSTSMLDNQTHKRVSSSSLSTLS
jgi:hypothetical protein